MLSEPTGSNVGRHSLSSRRLDGSASPLSSNAERRSSHDQPLSSNHQPLSSHSPPLSLNQKPTEVLAQPISSNHQPRRRNPRAMHSLERRAASGPLSIEVEHVLDVVHSEEPDAASRLRSLSRTQEWPGLEGKAQSLVPLAAWADLVAHFLERGPDALVELAWSRDNPEELRALAVAILETAAEPRRTSVAAYVIAISDPCGLNEPGPSPLRR
jgi:hypothetical protein